MLAGFMKPMPMFPANIWPAEFSGHRIYLLIMHWLCILSFTYRDIPSEVYPLGILLHEENGYSYQIATPEKALCDKLYSLPPAKNLSELCALLFDDLRIDEQEFWRLNMNSLNELAPLYRASNLKLLSKLIRRNK